MIKAGGADSVIPLMKMFEKFGIPSVGVIDKDKKIEKNLPDSDELFFTTSKCFDSEIVKRIIRQKRVTDLERILVEYDRNGISRCIDKNKLEKIIKEFGYKGITVQKSYKFEELTNVDKLFEVMYVSWFSINKGIMLGKTIGELLDKDEIPPCYRKAIIKAKELAVKYAR